jgi:pantoate--beta-alanine ligase
MVIFKTVRDIQDHLAARRSAGSKPGFIPTMGALHAGHISLVQQAKNNGMLTVCSIFLNPTQFNDKKDYEKYPVTAEADIELLLRAGCDILFMPPVEEVYPGGATAGDFDFGYLDTILEGAKRPGHFKGVGQVVARLLDIVQPDKLYLGQKDYQQCMVIARLIEMQQRNVQLVICPTQREADGLAMSSRNTRLTEPQRVIAGIIYQCLVSIESKQAGGKFAVVEKECLDLLVAKGFEPEYVALADARNLDLLEEYDGARPMVALIAARIGGVRLIDNLLINKS